LTGAEPAWDWDPVAELTGGGLKLGKPVGGVDGPSCSAAWDPDCAACCGPECGEGWALNPPLDVVGVAAWLGVALWVAARLAP
jgi:hypothetical protein